MPDAVAPNPAVPWYIRHRMRALLLFAGGFLLFGLTVATTVFVVTVNKLKTTAPYQIALEEVVNHRAVQSHLGQPVAATWLAAGQVNDDKGYTEMTFRVAGPTGKGTVRAITEREPGNLEDTWELVFLDVATYSDFGVQTVEIVNDKPPTGVDLPEPTQEAKDKYGVSE